MHLVGAFCRKEAQILYKVSSLAVREGVVRPIQAIRMIAFLRKNGSQSFYALFGTVRRRNGQK